MEYGDVMAKTMKNSLKVRKTAKRSSHGSYREKRKPNSPIVLAKAREKAAAQFGKDPAFREEIYGIQREGA
jgi:hypothetical protein